MVLHQSHNWRYSDSSRYDAVCINCNYTDESPQAHFPCGEELPPNHLLALAKQAGLKAQSETALSPQELKFARLLIEECLFVVGDETKGNWEVRTEIWNDIKSRFGMDP